jgi:hypothetical protein
LFDVKIAKRSVIKFFGHPSLLREVRPQRRKIKEKSEKNFYAQKPNLCSRAKTNKQASSLSRITGKSVPFYNNRLLGLPCFWVPVPQHGLYFSGITALNNDLKTCLWDQQKNPIFT